MPTLEQYQNMLRINKLRLDDELEIQAEMQMKISLELVRLNTLELEAKNNLKTIEAYLLIKLKGSGEKMTADEVKASVQVHKDRVLAWEKWQAAREVNEQWDGLLQAWTTKGYKLADVGALYASDYFAVRTVTKDGGQRRREVNAIDEESRSAMRRAHEQKEEPATETRRRRTL